MRPRLIGTLATLALLVCADAALAQRADTVLLNGKIVRKDSFWKIRE